MPILATDDLHKFYRQTNDMDKAWEMMAAMRCPSIVANYPRDKMEERVLLWRQGISKCLAS